MKVNKKITALKKLGEEEDSYVEASPEERISFMWELTAELWSLKDEKNVKRRLQRNVTRLIQPKKPPAIKKTQKPS